MKSIISFIALVTIKYLARLFYRFDIGWPNGNPDIKWNEVRMIVFLNHTSLLEPLYLGFLPVSFLWKLSKRMVAPGADKTLNRPLIGTLYKIFSPGMVAITRKRDDSWKQFMDSIYKDSVIVILPEGRMKRKNGLDLNGEKMTVKSGISEVLQELDSGLMIIAYSGGLHHVQKPDERAIHLFKTLKMNLDVLPIEDYKAGFSEEPNSTTWRKQVIADLQHRLETKVPLF